jgi:hypothetical protein
MAPPANSALAALALLLAAGRSTASIPSPLERAPAALRARLESYGHPLARPGARAPVAGAAPVFGARCSPLDFGADPLGVSDSAPALSACVDFCKNYSVAIDGLGHFPGDDSFGNGKYIANAGGCLIDLGGGEYKLSSPVIIPEFLGNMQLGHGSLVADDSGAFPADSFLLVVGVAGSCRVPQGSCNVAINFDEIFFDGRHVASALQINNVMGTTVSNSYFLNFTS